MTEVAPLLRLLAKHGVAVEPYHVACRECDEWETYVYSEGCDPRSGLAHKPECLVGQAQAFVDAEWRSSATGACRNHPEEAAA